MTAAHLKAPDVAPVSRGAKWSGCAGKQAFETFALADHIARRQRFQEKGAALPYRCGLCSKWHVGTKPYALGVKRAGAPVLIKPEGTGP